MKPKQKARWEKMRRKGKSRFILLQGGVLFGLLGMGTIFPALKFIYRFVNAGYTLSFFDKDYQAGILFGFVEWFAIGCLWGWLAWHSSEMAYLRDE
jgi:hypothetical protein